MSRLPILHVFLLLLALHVPRAQGQPIKRSTKDYNNLMEELESILKSPTMPPPQKLDSNEIGILEEENLLRLNLDAFLKAAQNLEHKETRIRIVKALKKLKELLCSPTTTTTGNPITFKTDSHDFKAKMIVYLKKVNKFILQSCPTSSSGTSHDGALGCCKQ